MLQRHRTNPILTREDVPALTPQLADASAVFNPGALAVEGRVHLLLRVQDRGRRTHLLTASSNDGVRFEVGERPVPIDGLEGLGRELFHVYDPRITRIEDQALVVVAMDVEDGCHLGVARATGSPHAAGLDRLELLGVEWGRDSRNGVMFPEQIGGRYLRLERPNRTHRPGEPAGGDEIVLSASDDLVRWELAGSVMRGRPHYWDEFIGSGPPPVKTHEGWLHVYHGIANHFAASNVYQAGVVLLDLEDPSKVVARGSANVLEPREDYELAGQVSNVVFPSGMIVDDVDEAGFATPESRVRLYYGAADTCIGVAESTVGWLLAQCRV